MIDYQEVIDCLAEIIEVALPIGILFALTGKLMAVFIGMAFHGRINLD